MNYLERFDKVTEAKCKKMKSFKNVALTNIASGRVHFNNDDDFERFYSATSGMNLSKIILK